VTGQPGIRGLRIGLSAWQWRHATLAACPVLTTSRRYGLRRTCRLVTGRSHRPRSTWLNQARLVLLPVTRRYKQPHCLWLEQFQIDYLRGVCRRILVAEVRRLAVMSAMLSRSRWLLFRGWRAASRPSGQGYLSSRVGALDGCQLFGGRGRLVGGALPSCLTIKVQGCLYGHSGAETKGQAEPARTGRGPFPARCRRSPAFSKGRQLRRAHVAISSHDLRRSSSLVIALPRIDDRLVPDGTTVEGRQP
jgi:hypothetical protein